MNKNKYRLRYAPSPTGYLHIGNARTALFNYLLAKHNKGDFIVRIEDTDVNRNVDNAVQAQFDDLNWLGIIADESSMNPGRFGPYSQLKRLDVYDFYAKQLINDKKAFYCFCTQEELEKEREYQKSQNIKAPIYSGKCAKLPHNEVEILKNKKPYTIRFRVKENEVYKYNDLIRGEVSFESKDIGDFVIVKANKIPTYNFAVVVDDHLMHISHVLRGEEHISNTPKQLMIYEAFCWDKPLFGHLTLIVNKDRKKLSKRDNDVLQFIEQYRNQGYLPEAVLNFIALLGWSPEGEKEFFSKEELIKIFKDSGFSKAPGMFDVKKLNWMNAKYIKQMDNKKYYDFCYNFLSSKYDLQTKSKEWIEKFINLYKKELEYGAQIIDFAKMYLSENYVFEKKYKQIFTENKYKDSFGKKLFNKFLAISNWDEKEIKELIKKVGLEGNLKGKDLFMPIRLLTTNSDHGPDLSKTIYLLGKDKVMKNIKYILV